MDSRWRGFNSDELFRICACIGGMLPSDAPLRDELSNRLIEEINIEFKKIRGDL